MKDSWCHVSVDGKTTKAKILHKGRGKFEIVETQDGKYVGKLIDASEVYNCRECDKADHLFLIIAVDKDKLMSTSGILSSSSHWSLLFGQDLDARWKNEQVIRILDR
jgi:hypothetical protein